MVAETFFRVPQEEDSVSIKPTPANKKKEMKKYGLKERGKKKQCKKKRG